MKTRTWILIFTVVFLIFAGLALLLGCSVPAQRAEIYSDGKLIHTIDLNVDQTVTVDSAYGSNTVTVRGGKIAVTEATCPDHVCVNRGYHDGGMDIICLPNRLVIRFENGAAPDGVVG